MFFTSAAIADGLTQPVPYSAPKVGTIFRYDNFIQRITDTDGMVVEARTSSNRPFYRVGMFIGFGSLQAYRFPHEKMQELWPLEVGKSVAFDVSGTDNQGNQSTWHWTIKVVRAEQIKTLAGTFDAFVIESDERAISVNYEGLYTYWFAPAISYFARYNYRTIIGAGTPFDGTLTSVSVPK